jgi:hypothetical protein
MCSRIAPHCAALRRIAQRARECGGVCCDLCESVHSSLQQCVVVVTERLGVRGSAVVCSNAEVCGNAEVLKC